MSTEKYQYSLHINQRAAQELGIKNASQAIIFEYLAKAVMWANPVNIGDQTYYWVHRKTTGKQLPLLNLKDDTVYRHYKNLDELGLIEYRKHKGMDCIRITQKAKEYFFGDKSEIQKISSNEGSEINPTYSKSTKSCNEYSEKLPNKHGNRSDILVKTNISKTTTTDLDNASLIWPKSIPKNLRPSIIKTAKLRSLDETQTALNELAGRLESSKPIYNPVGYFKSYLDGMDDGTFTPTFATNAEEKRRNSIRAENNLANIFEQSEISRLKTLEEHNNKPMSNGQKRRKKQDMKNSQFFKRMSAQ